MAEAILSSTPLPNTLTEIDREIAALQDRIYLLRSRRNLIIPIGQLPSEILAKIFSSAITLPYVATRDTKKLLHISWVSRQWRDVALGCASLWTYIKGKNVSWLNESIRRACQAPLSMNLAITSMTEEGQGSYLQHLAQIEELRVEMNITLQNQQHLLDLWRTPAPLLRYLDVKRAEIPSDLFLGQAPELQVVTLRNCRFDLEMLSFSSLKELTISNPHNAPSLASLLSKLQHMQQLTKLKLFSALKGEFGGEIECLPFVDLPDLEFLHLYYVWSPGAIELMRHLSYPVKANIRVEHDGGSEPSEFLVYLDVAHQGYKERTVLDTIECVSSMSNYVSFRYKCTSTNVRVSDTTVTTPNADADAGIGIVTLDPPVDSTLNDLFRLLCSDTPNRLQTLTTLLIMQDQDVTVETWKDVFSQLPQLHEIRLEEKPARTLLLFLTTHHPRSKEDIHQFDSSGNPLLPFPVLKRLEFSWTTYLLESPSFSSSDINYEALRDVFALRRDLGNVMSEWYVPQGVWTDEVAEMMKAVVENLDVWGYDDSDEEDDLEDSQAD